MQLAVDAIILQTAMARHEKPPGFQSIDFHYRGLAANQACPISVIRIILFYRPLPGTADVQFKEKQ